MNRGLIETRVVFEYSRWVKKWLIFFRLIETRVVFELSNSPIYFIFIND